MHISYVAPAHKTMLVRDACLNARDALEAQLRQALRLLCSLNDCWGAKSGTQRC